MLHLLTAKPVDVCRQRRRGGFTNNALLDGCARRAARRTAPSVVPVCAAIEAEIAQLDEAERAEFLETLGLDEPGLNRVIRGGLHAAGPADLFHRRPEGGARLDDARAPPRRRRPG